MLATSISRISGHHFPYLREEFPLGALPMPVEILPNYTLVTERLILRRWRGEDMGHFIAMQADPEVMRYMKGCMSMMDALLEMETYERYFDDYGYSMWAVTLRESGEFIGAVGLEPYVATSATTQPLMSWRLRREYWGQNYAYEAASAVLDYAENTLHLTGITADVTPDNTRSLALKRRLGMLSYRKAA